MWQNTGMTITLPPPFLPGHATLGLAALTCDICKHRYKTAVRATFDAKTPMGWAFICTDHFISLECQTGLGLGQALIDYRSFDEATLERIRLANKEA